MGKAFPVLYVTDVRRSVEFYTLLGYESTYQFPLEGDPALCRPRAR
jgi:lactoylglutathione lyase